MPEINWNQIVFITQVLLDVTCKTVANMIKGKALEEIRKTFNIKNDFTPSEEEQVRFLYDIRSVVWTTIF